MNLVEKLIERWLKKYTIWPLAIFIFLSVFLLSWLESKSKIWFMPSFDMPGIFYNILLLIGLVLLVIFFLWIWERVLYLSLEIRTLFKDEINSIPRISKWIFQGSLKIEGEFLEITASDAGCLIKDRLYKNFLMTFNLKILNGGRAGIIFRAQDLENYLMIQIVLADVKYSDDTSGTIIYDIIPHIRFSGNWETFNITPEPYHQTKLRYIGERGLLVNLEVKDYVAILTIESNNETEKFHWDIPTHTAANILQQYAVVAEREDRNDRISLHGKVDSLDGKFVPKIWFRDKHGRVGFRAHAWEKAKISNLRVEKI